MEEQFGDFHILTTQVAEYLDTQLYFSSSAIEQYRKIWRRVLFFMDSRDYEQFGPEVEKELFQYHFNGRSKRELHAREIRLYNGIKMLSDFIMLGKVNLLIRPKLKEIVFDGAVGEVINGYIDYKRTVNEVLSVSKGYTPATCFPVRWFINS